jgi:D-threo-aldose 1-dehydrogenase
MAIVLPTRFIGKTALTVTEVGFGTAPLDNLYRPISDADDSDWAIATIDAGIAYFGTRWPSGLRRCGTFGMTRIP